jgi:photosystem II stability/assembly factor-like uncharacterized protein
MYPYQRTRAAHVFGKWLFRGSLLLAGLAARPGMAADSEPYAWHSVQIGGGGYVSGLVFHPREKGLYYARTDVGGAYRWDDTAKQWIPLTDWLGAEDANLSGIESLALDPNDTSRVYLAAGTYTSDRAGNAAILRSGDRGRTFQRADLPFKLGANELGRGNGERLVVDPNDGHILFLGSPGAGLWRSADSGGHWTKVDAFPAVATSLAATAQNNWRRQPIGIVFVVYEPTSGKAGRPTQTLYAGVSTQQTSVFRSTDGGAHWSAVPGQPVGLRPNHMNRASDGAWYLSYGDEPGPDSMNDGAVWKFEPATERWTDITPIPRTGKPAGYGWGDVVPDPHNPRILMASTFCHYTPNDLMFRSTDGGKSWTSVFPRSTFDHSAAPWTADHTPHWMSTVAIDPYDPDHVLFVTGYGIWASRDMLSFDRGQEVNWWFQDANLEETVPLGLISPGDGAPLISALGDLDGFRHDSLNVAALQFSSPPRYANGESIDYAALAPNVIVRSGRIRKQVDVVRAAYSLDGAKTWTAFASEPPEGRGEGTIAVSADGHTTLWMPAGAAHAYATADLGAHWTQVVGLSENARVLSDRVDPSRFYAWDGVAGVLYASNDNALHFSPIGGALGVEALQARSDTPKQLGMQLYASPDAKGELFLATRQGLIRGGDDGSVTARIGHVEVATSLGFGKAAPGHKQATLFLAGKVDGKRGLFRSSDDGAHWLRINDDAHQYGELGHVTGDPRIFGRVYFATGGRGIFYGDPVPEKHS